MRQDDLPGALRVLTLWNMAPRPPSAEIPNPERSTIEIANAFVGEAEGRTTALSWLIWYSRSSSPGSNWE